MEALYYGVTVLCIPFFGDQTQNCASATTNGFATNLQLKDITKQTFSDAFDDVLENPK